MNPCKKIIISRTDNLGDVVLTLPIAGILKSKIKDCQLYFIGKAYTRPIIEGSIFIDQFLDREEVLTNPMLLKEINADVIIHIYPDKEISKAAFKAGIPMRIGTSHRLFHWLYCNQRINLSRKNSTLHEAQLNIKLLGPLDIKEEYSLNAIENFYGFSNVKALPESISSLISDDKINIVFHPKSKGSAREWPLDSYFKLAQELGPDKFRIFITGTASEGEAIQKGKIELIKLPHVVDLTGKLSLEQLIGLIHTSDGLVACSTGPLHIGAALGKNVCGIYPPMKPIHPGRWAPIGEKATTLVLKKDCSDCKKSFNCHCIQSIRIEEVFSVINNWRK